MLLVCSKKHWFLAGKFKILSEVDKSSENWCSKIGPTVKWMVVVPYPKGNSNSRKKEHLGLRRICSSLSFSIGPLGIFVASSPFRRPCQTEEILWMQMPFWIACKLHWPDHSNHIILGKLKTHFSSQEFPVHFTLKTSSLCAEITKKVSFDKFCERSEQRYIST